LYLRSGPDKAVSLNASLIVGFSSGYGAFLQPLDDIPMTDNKALSRHLPPALQQPAARQNAAHQAQLS